VIWEKPIPFALHRPNLFMGCERKPMQFVILISAGLALNGMNIVAFVVSAVIWFGCQGALRWAAKEDPQWLEVYMRNWKFKKIRYDFYPRPYGG
jgi:type IV secretory pathway TrbD component